MAMLPLTRCSFANWSNQALSRFAGAQVSAALAASGSRSPAIQISARMSRPWKWLKPRVLSNYVQRAGTAPDGQCAGTHHLDDLGALAQIVHELVDLGFRGGELDHETLGRGRQHPAAGAHDITAHRIDQLRLDA